MPDPSPSAERLLAHARSVAERSHAPYSGPGAAAGAAVLLADGRWAAAPRIENASFPLTIPALQGALALAALAGAVPGGVADAPAVAVAHTRDLTPGDLAAIAQMLGGDWRHDSPGLAVARADLPEIGRAVSLLLDPAPTDAASGTAAALAAAARAVVPASDFPVGAVVQDEAGRAVAGANVEVAGDWTRGLCAERTALVAARAAGLGPIVRLLVACTRAPGGTPCGGCRQVIAELAPDAEVVIWRGADAPAVTTPEALLPGAFRGDRLPRSSGALGRS